MSYCLLSVNIVIGFQRKLDRYWIQVKWEISWTCQIYYQQNVTPSLFRMSLESSPWVEMFPLERFSFGMSRVDASPNYHRVRTSLTTLSCYPPTPMIIRVPTQVLQSLMKSYIRFFIYKALQGLFLGYFWPNRSYKVLFLIEKEISVWQIKVPPRNEVDLDYWFIFHNLNFLRFLCKFLLTSWLLATHQSQHK